MKNLLVCLLALVAFNLITGCAGENTASRDGDRLGARAGVTVASHDMSRVVPTRPNVAAAN